MSEYDDASATLHLPMDDDVEVIRHLLEREYDKIEDEYAMIPEEPRNEYEEQIMLEGSLFQELLAQLNNQ